MGKLSEEAQGRRDGTIEVVVGEVEVGKVSEEVQRRRRDGAGEAAIGEVERDDTEVGVAANSVPGEAVDIIGGCCIVERPGGEGRVGIVGYGILEGEENLGLGARRYVCGSSYDKKRDYAQESLHDWDGRDHE